MTSNAIILPSLLSAPFFNLGKSILDLETQGVRVFHYDVMDGHFVPNLTFGPCVLKSLGDLVQSKFDVHLMVTNPEEMIAWFDLPNVRSITVHIESSKDIHCDIKNIKNRNKWAGISLNPSTPAGKLKLLLSEIDHILVMTVHPGLPAQKFINDTLSKIEYFAAQKKQYGYSFKIQVDGGIQEETMKWVLDAGADEIVSGNAIFAADDPVKQYLILNDILQK